MPLRYEPGGGEMAGRMSVYRGPLLLAYDVLLTEKGPPDPAPCTPSDLAKARLAFPTPAPDQARIGRFAAWLIVDVPRADGTSLRLCDFASAGARAATTCPGSPPTRLLRQRQRRTIPRRQRSYHPADCCSALVTRPACRTTSVCDC